MDTVCLTVQSDEDSDEHVNIQTTQPHTLDFFFEDNEIDRFEFDLDDESLCIHNDEVGHHPRNITN